ncbi:hypothetical protein MRX96_026072 [Rhipicephalus microplus]
MGRHGPRLTGAGQDRGVSGPRTRERHCRVYSPRAAFSCARRLPLFSSAAPLAELSFFFSVGKTSASLTAPRAWSARRVRRRFSRRGSLRGVAEFTEGSLRIGPSLQTLRETCASALSRFALSVARTYSVPYREVTRCDVLRFTAAALLADSLTAFRRLVGNAHTTRYLRSLTTNEANKEVNSLLLYVVREVLRGVPVFLGKDRLAFTGPEQLRAAAGEIRAAGACVAAIQQRQGARSAGCGVMLCALLEIAGRPPFACGASRGGLAWICARPSLDPTTHLHEQHSARVSDEWAGVLGGRSPLYIIREEEEVCI